MPSIIQSQKLSLGSDILIIYLAMEEQRKSAKDSKLAKEPTFSSSKKPHRHQMERLGDMRTLDYLEGVRSGAGEEVWQRCASCGGADAASLFPHQLISPEGCTFS